MMRIMARRMKAATVLAADSSGATRRPAARRGCARGSERLARHRFLKSTHIAALVGRSLDRTNDRLLRLFHAGYVDRPRAQLDYYPTAGSSRSPTRSPTAALDY